MKQGKKRRVLLIRRLQSKSTAHELLKPGFDWLSRQQTTVEAADNRIQRPPPRKSFVFNFFFFFIGNLLRRKRGFQFTKHVTMTVRGDPVCRKERDRHDIGLVFNMC